MKIENENEWIYYYFMKDEEALPTLLAHFEPMIYSMYTYLCSQNSYLHQYKDDYYSTANYTLVDCLEKYRMDSNTSFHMYYYVCLKRKFIDVFRHFKHSSFPPYINTISFDHVVKEDSNMYYCDVIPSLSIDANTYVIEKCQVDYLLNKAKQELSDRDYQILKFKQDGYSVNDICEYYGVSKQFVYYRLKKIRNWFLEH